MEAYARRLEAKMRTIDELKRQLNEHPPAATPTEEDNHNSRTRAPAHEAQLAPGTRRDGGDQRTDQPPQRNAAPPRAISDHDRGNEDHVQHDHNGPMMVSDIAGERNNNYDDGYDDDRRQPRQEQRNDRDQPQPLPRHDPVVVAPPMSIGEKLAEIERYEQFLQSENGEVPPPPGIRSWRQRSNSGDGGGRRTRQKGGAVDHDDEQAEADLDELQQEIDRMYHDEDEDDDDDDAYRYHDDTYVDVRNQRRRQRHGPENGRPRQRSSTRQERNRHAWPAVRHFNLLFGDCLGVVWCGRGTVQYSAAGGGHPSDISLLRTRIRVAGHCTTYMHQSPRAYRLFMGTFGVVSHVPYLPSYRRTVRTYVHTLVVNGADMDDIPTITDGVCGVRSERCRPPRCWPKYQYPKAEQPDPTIPRANARVHGPIQARRK